jgi:hypothetical protein
MNSSVNVDLHCFFYFFWQIVGSSYSMAEEIALKEAENPGIGFLSPYNHAEVW